MSAPSQTMGARWADPSTPLAPPKLHIEGNLSSSQCLSVFSVCSSQHLVYWLSMLLEQVRWENCSKSRPQIKHLYAFVILRVNDLCFLGAYDSNNNTFCLDLFRTIVGPTWSNPDFVYVSLFASCHLRIAGNYAVFLRSSGRAVALGIEWMTWSWHFGESIGGLDWTHTRCTQLGGPTLLKNRTRIFSRCTTQEMDDVTLALVGSSGPPLDKQYISTESKYQNPQEPTSGSTESV
jgi:hypothetical protein